VDTVGHPRPDVGKTQVSATFGVRRGRDHQRALGPIEKAGRNRLDQSSHLSGPSAPRRIHSYAQRKNLRTGNQSIVRLGDEEHPRNQAGEDNLFSGQKSVALRTVEWLNCFRSADSACAGRAGRRASRIVVGEMLPPQMRRLRGWVRSKAKTGVGQC
jgi:hypothetical protein